MRVNDRWMGLILVVAGLAVFLRARTFPTLGGMDYGPDLFPSIAAVGLAGCGLVIALGGRFRQTAPSGETVRAEARGPMRPGVVRLAAVPAAVLLVGLGLDPLGFHIAVGMALAGLLAAFGLRPAAAIGVAIPVIFAIHVVFYTILRVPLPWGLLTPVAW